MTNPCKYWGVVPAAGVGQRMQADRPKQYLDLGGRAVIEHTLERMLKSDAFEAVAVAVSSEDPYWTTLQISSDRRILRAEGGAERADSVLNALYALENLADDDDWVLVHDAARPCITASDIHRMIEMLKSDPVGGVLALPVHDTLKAIEGTRISETIDRSRIWRALTPQMFRFAALREALELASTWGALVTDEASALELAGYNPAIVEGRSDNIKITRPEDLSLAAFFLEQQC